MEKKITTKTVFNLQSGKPILWKHIKHFKFEDDDFLDAGYVEPWTNGSDNSGGDHYEVEVLRDVLETDDEYNRRIKGEVKQAERLKESRFETYLKLKKEFEPEK